AASDHQMELFRMKEAAEQHLRASAAPWTIVRSAAFLETWIDLMVQTTDRSGRVLVFGRGDNPINFVSVRDVGKVVERVIADPGARMQTLDIGGPENITMTKLANAVQPAGPDVAPRHVPPSALRAMSLVLRPFWAARARQAAAALALATSDMRFDPAAIRARYPHLPLTSPFDVIARIAREQDRRPQ